MSRRLALVGLSLPTIVLCSTTIVSHTFGRGTYGLLLPAIEEDLGLNHSQSGLAGTAIYAAYLVALIAVVVASPHVEPIAIMRAGLLAAATGLGLLVVADGLWTLTVGLGLAGGAGAGIWMTAPILATEGVATHRRGLVIGLLTSTIGVANLALGVGVKALRSTTGDDLVWRPVWAASAAITIVILCAVIVVVRTEPTAPVAGGFSLAALRAVPGWKSATVAYALFGGVGSGFSAFLLAALEDRGLDRADTALVFSAMGLLSIVGGVGTGALSDQLGRPVLMLAAMATQAVGIGLVAVLSGPWSVLGALLFGLMGGAFPALLASYFRDHANDRAFSRAFSAMTLVFSFVALVSPGLVGWSADRTNSFTTPYLGLATLALGAFAATARLPRDRPKVRS